MAEITYKSISAMQAGSSLTELIENNIEELLSPVLIIGEVSESQLQKLYRHHQVTEIQCPSKIEDLSSILASTSRKYETIISMSLLGEIDKPKAALECINHHCNRFALNYRQTFTEWLMQRSKSKMFVKSIIITKGLAEPGSSQNNRLSFFLSSTLVLLPALLMISGRLSGLLGSKLYGSLLVAIVLFCLAKKVGYSRMIIPQQQECKDRFKEEIN